MRRHQPQAEQASPVLAEEGDAAEVELQQPGLQPVHVGLVRVVLGPGRFVRTAEPDEIRCNHSEAGVDERRDHAVIQVRPGGLAVDQKHHRPVAFVDVGHP